MNDLTWTLRRIFAVLCFTTLSITSLASTEASVTHGRMRSTEMRIYSQNLIDSRTNNLVTQNHARLFFPRLLKLEWASPFLGMHLETDARSSEREIWNDNRFAPGVGLQLKSDRLGLGAIIESMVVYRTDVRAANRHPQEFDAQSVGYHFASWTFKETGFFAESYSELVSRMSWEGNAIFAHQSKSGFRLLESTKYQWQRSVPITWDAFLEFVAHEDLAGLPYENYAELRAGSRLGYFRDRTSMVISVTSETGLYAGDDGFKTPLKGLLTLTTEM